MTLPSTGTISLSQIQDEFGGSNPISISEYYGAKIGSDCYPSYLQESGTISMSTFRGLEAYYGSCGGGSSS